MIESVVHDQTNDVLYVKLGHRIKISRELEHDAATILNMDESGQVVGLQVIEASGLSPEAWAEHPDRAEIPEDLHDAVAFWIIHAAEVKR